MRRISDRIGRVVQAAYFAGSPASADATVATIKRLMKRIKVVHAEMRRRMHAPVVDSLQWLKRVLQGHYNYFGVPGNIDQLGLFKDELVRRFLKMLRRRSQRSKLVWVTFGPYVNRILPSPRVVHLYPEYRFRAKYSR